VLVPGPIDHLSPAAIRRQIDVNFLGTVLVTRAFLPYFRRHHSGHLIHVGSLGGIVPLAGEAVYSATKFAVRGFCLALALELKGTGVSVSVVCPDSVDTPQLATEAAGQGSAFSFLSEPLDPAQAAGAILDTIGRPRVEVAVPAGRELPAKLLAWSPALLYRLYPLLERWGAARRSRFATGRVSAGPSATSAASPRPT
jgi:3-oxoacyl-[acyl-carrier protein] reductase